MPDKYAHLKALGVALLVIGALWTLFECPAEWRAVLGLGYLALPVLYKVADVIDKAQARAAQEDIMPVHDDRPPRPRRGRRYKPEAAYRVKRGNDGPRTRTL